MGELKSFLEENFSSNHFLLIKNTDDLVYALEVFLLHTQDIDMALKCELSLKLNY